MRAPLSKSQVSHSFHPGPAPQVRLGNVGDTAWLSILDETGLEFITIFLTPQMLRVLHEGVETAEKYFATLTESVNA